MNINLLVLLIGIISDACGYLFSIFFMQPILRFRDYRNEVLMNFIYYAQVVSAEGLNDNMQKLYHERVLANRKSSAKLSAVILELPKLYLLYLTKGKSLKPRQAASRLIEFANITEYERAGEVEDFIRKNIGLPLKN